MQKQGIMVLAGLAVVLALYFFGKRTGTPPAMPQAAAAAQVPSFDVESFITSSKSKLSPSQTTYLASLEESVKRGDVKEQQLRSFTAMADFWKDSARIFEPYAYYLAEAAKLDNSEKSLTFAGQLFLDNLRAEADPAKLEWKTNTAISLFEKALEVNPKSTDGRIGLGGAYIMGKGRSGDPQHTMTGIQQLLSVVREDSTNMKAQLMLGIGGAVSRQYDKAVERLLKVVKAEPQNSEAVAFLADTYAAMGNNTEAINWYKRSKELVKNPQYAAEVDKRIKELQGQ